MNSSEINEKYKGVKELLTFWGLPHLLEQLQEEDITLEELKMMKLHHLNELLANFKLGTRIRFEYCLQKWRQSINRPLVTYVGSQPPNVLSARSSFGPIKPTVLLPPIKKNEIIPEITTKIAKASDDKTISQAVRKPIAPPEAVNHVEPQQRQLSAENSLPTEKPMRLIIENKPNNPNATSKDKTACTRFSKFGTVNPGINVSNILRKSGRKGIALLHHYKKFQFFSEDHRQLLLQLIVNYFDINDYHLSLGTSYQLENQILQLFPTEQLKDYRTARRGRMYVKYCNMKRKRSSSTAGTSPTPEVIINDAMGGIESTENSLNDADMNEILRSDNELYNEIKVEFEKATQREQGTSERWSRRRLRDASNPLSLRNSIFQSFYRLNKEAFLMILKEITPIISQNSSILPVLQFATTLRHLAVGSFQGAIGRDSDIALERSTVCKTIWKVIHALEMRICNKWVKLARSDEEIRQCKSQFLECAGMPGVIGCMDNMQVKIIRPSINETVYFNRQGYCSINVMLICDQNMIIRSVDATNPGCSYDSSVWKASSVREYFLSQYKAGDKRSWLLADSSHALEPFLLTPYRGPRRNSKEDIFNQRHSSARKVVQQTIGVLKSRFRCLQIGLRYSPVKCSRIVNVCCALNNICTSYGLNVEDSYSEIEDSDEEFDEIVEESEFYCSASNTRDNVATSFLDLS